MYCFTILNYARIVLQQTQELRAAAQSIVRQEESVLKIAIENSLQKPEFGKILYDFSQLFPATQIEIFSVASPDVIALVESGRVNIGLMFSDNSFKREVNLCFIDHIQLCAVCGADHPLSKVINVDIYQVSGHTQIIVRGENGGELDHEVSISALQWSSNNVHCSIELMMQGNDWGYLPLHLVLDHINTGKLHKIDMRLDNKPWSSSAILTSGIVVLIKRFTLKILTLDNLDSD